jgi:transposase
MEPIDVEIRAQVLAACDAGEGTRVVAVRFRVSESWVRRAKQQRRETGQIAPKTPSPPEPKWKAWADWLQAKVKAQPDIYLHELQALLRAERNIEVCLATICNACQALELTRKKRRWSPASNSAPMSPSNANNGAQRKPKSRQRSTFSSTKHGPKRA